MSLATNVAWKDVKKWVDDTQLINILNYKEFELDWLVWVEYEGLTMWARVEKASSDAEDFVLNYKPLTVLKKTTTDEGLKHSTVQGVLNKQYVRKYCCQGFTSQIQNGCGFFSYLMKDENGNFTTDSSECIETLVRFEPNFSYNILGGDLEIIDFQNEDLIVHVIGNPDIPEEMGGSVKCIFNEKYTRMVEIKSNEAMPLKYIEGHHTNVILIDIFHPKGLQKEFQIKINFYA